MNEWDHLQGNDLAECKSNDGEHWGPLVTEGCDEAKGPGEGKEETTGADAKDWALINESGGAATSISKINARNAILQLFFNIARYHSHSRILPTKIRGFIRVASSRKICGASDHIGMGEALSSQVITSTSGGTGSFCINQIGIPVWNRSSVRSARKDQRTIP